MLEALPMSFAVCQTADFSQVDFDRNMDYLALARAFGIPGYVAKTRQEAEQAFAQALGSGGPALIACQIPKNQLV